MPGFDLLYEGPLTEGSGHPTTTDNRSSRRVQNPPISKEVYPEKYDEKYTDPKGTSHHRPKVLGQDPLGPSRRNVKIPDRYPWCLSEDCIEKTTPLVFLGRSKFPSSMSTDLYNDPDIKMFYDRRWHSTIHSTPTLSYTLQ